MGTYVKLDTLKNTSSKILWMFYVTFTQARPKVLHINILAEKFNFSLILELNEYADSLFI